MTALPFQKMEGVQSFSFSAAAGQLGGLLRAARAVVSRFFGGKTGAWGWRYAGGGGSRAANSPRTDPVSKDKALRARKSAQLSSPQRPRETPPPRNQGGLRGVGAGPAQQPARKGGPGRPSGAGRVAVAHRAPIRGGGAHRTTGGAGRGRGSRGPRPPRPGGAVGAPAGRGRALSAAAPLWEGASPGTRWRGKGGIAGARHAERPALPALRRGRGGGVGDTARPPPRRGHRPTTLSPVTPCLSVPAASVWRLPPPPHSAAPRPRQLQKMAAKAAPVATLPRAGRARGPPAAPLPSPARGLLAGRRDPRGLRGAEAAAGASAEGEGRLPAGGEGYRVGEPGGQCSEGARGPPPQPA